MGKIIGLISQPEVKSQEKEQEKKPAPNPVKKSEPKK